MCWIDTQNAQKQNTQQPKKKNIATSRKMQYKRRIETKTLNPEKQR